MPDDDPKTEAELTNEEIKALPYAEAIQYLMRTEGISDITAMDMYQVVILGGDIIED